MSSSLAEGWFAGVGVEVLQRGKPRNYIFSCTLGGPLNIALQIDDLYRSDGSTDPRKLTEAITTAAVIIHRRFNCVVCSRKNGCQIYELSEREFPTEDGL